MEILYRDLAKRTPVKILNSDLSLRSLTGNFCGNLLYRTCTDSRLPYKGILPSSFYREPVREILQTIFYRDFRKRNLQNLKWHLFLMFLATLFGVSCQNIFFKKYFHYLEVSKAYSFILVLSQWPGVSWRRGWGRGGCHPQPWEFHQVWGITPSKKMCNNNPTASCNSKCIMRVTHRVRGNNQYDPNISKNEGVLSYWRFCFAERNRRTKVGGWCGEPN